VRMYCSLIAEYSSCPAVSRTSRSATSSSMTHCLRYESKTRRATVSYARYVDNDRNAREGTARLCRYAACDRAGSSGTSVGGLDLATKWLWMSWIVRQDLPTPPPPTTTSLYSRRN